MELKQTFFGTPFLVRCFFPLVYFSVFGFWFRFRFVAFVSLVLFLFWIFLLRLSHRLHCQISQKPEKDDKQLQH